MHRLISATALVLSLSLTSSLAQSAVPADFRLTLERQACFGFCPMYTVSVDATGRVTYQGERFVKVRGLRSARLTPAQFKQLWAFVQASNLGKYNNTYTAQDATDLPSSIVTLIQNRRYKSVNHYHGDRSAPEALRALEDGLDRLIGTARWVGEPGVLYRE